MLLFIQDGFQVLVGFRNSNTSHVIVYPVRTSRFIPSLRHSNTSHVIVYQWKMYQEGEVHLIQIHLMLLFILPGLHPATLKGVFKYISCYCLSVRFRRKRPACVIQIHLMLLFIRSLCLARLSLFHIQIHLMLLFILYD